MEADPTGDYSSCFVYLFIYYYYYYYYYYYILIQSFSAEIIIITIQDFGKKSKRRVKF